MSAERPKTPSFASIGAAHNRSLARLFQRTRQRERGVAWWRLHEPACWPSYYGNIPRVPNRFKNRRNISLLPDGWEPDAIARG
jgi:hypothetical protein